jgi:hypothetical protein
MPDDDEFNAIETINPLALVCGNDCDPIVDAELLELGSDRTDLPSSKAKRSNRAGRRTTPPGTLSGLDRAESRSGAVLLLGVALQPPPAPIQSSSSYPRPATSFTGTRCTPAAFADNIGLCQVNHAIFPNCLCDNSVRDATYDEMYSAISNTVHINGFRCRGPAQFRV